MGTKCDKKEVSEDNEACWVATITNKSCQKTTTLAGRQPSLNRHPRLKFFKSRSKFKVKNYGTMWKVLSWGIHMGNMKALPVVVFKLWPMLKFLKRRSKFKVKVTRSKIVEPCERSCHNEYTCEIWKPYVLWYLSYGQCKSFSKVGPSSRSRSKIMVPCERSWHKKNTWNMEALPLKLLELWLKLKFLSTQATQTRTLGLWH